MGTEQKPTVEKVAKRHINRLRMEDRAYRYIYGCPVFHPMRVALVALLQEYAIRRYDCHPDTKDPIVDQKRVEDKLAASSAIAPSGNKLRGEIKKAVDLGLFSKLARGDGGPKLNKAYLYFTDEQYRKVIELNDLFSKIDKVLEDQASNPTNKWAGQDYVPREVFYNIEVDDGL